MSAQPFTSTNEALLKSALLSIANDLQRDDCEGEELKSRLTRYYDLLINQSNIDYDSTAARTSLDFENGMAIGSKPAARCIKDWLRTKIFVRGIFNAIKDIQGNKKGPVHIFYAGTGPFATLLLPIMATLSPADIQCTLMEINPLSFSGVQQMIKQCGFQKYVKDFVLGDATQYSFKDPESIDILLSETMEVALKIEQQVPLLMNLIPQLKKETVLIPQQIEVQASLMLFAPDIRRTAATPFSSYCIPLETIINVNPKSIRQYAEMAQRNPQENPFPQTVLQLEKETMIEFHTLAALTTIQVYGEEWLHFADCDLTKPLALEKIEEVTGDRILKLQYNIDDVPGFKVEWEV